MLQSDFIPVFSITFYFSSYLLFLFNIWFDKNNLHLEPPLEISRFFFSFHPVFVCVDEI